MPTHNRFHHQNYAAARTARVELLRPPSPEQAGAEWAAQLPLIAEGWRQSGVAAVYLIHGTFVGSDALGVLTEVARFAPEAAAKLRHLQKRALEHLTEDAGNYTREFAEELSEAINARQADPIPVRNFEWSSENNHIGRADGAVRLIDELESRHYPPGARILIWAHSHGGNLLALVTNLLANDRRTNRKFFRATRSFFRWPFSGRFDLPLWRRVRNRLRTGARSLRKLRLDLVTFGTPVRYGWDLDGCSSLLHFIHHRPVQGTPEHLASFPNSLDEVLEAEFGDYIQQLGIAGTNFAPPIWSWRAWIADVRLGRLVQQNQRRRDLLERLKMGVRAHCDGENLLVDYGVPEGHVGQHLAGHAVYTRREWMPFHALEITRRLYPTRGGAAQPTPSRTPAHDS